MYRSLTLIAALASAAGTFTSPAFAQNIVPPADLHPPINLDADTLRSRFAPSNLGLKPNTSGTAAATILPFGIDYNREAKSLMMPLDGRNEWGVGVGLNINASKIIELSPGGVLGLQQPNRAPGVTLHKKF
jgi:hypothetical protein